MIQKKGFPMAKLDPYLQHKASVLAQRREQFTANPDGALVRLKATSHVAGNTGVRPVNIVGHITM